MEKDEQGARRLSLKLRGKLDVTNGTVVTFSFITGRAEVVTVTSGDVAHIDAKTGLVVIQKPI